MSEPTPSPTPYVPPPPPETEACGCCDGTVVETPQAIHNRAGLSAISYRIGDYARFRASLHAALATTQLGTRDDSDFTIGLIDAFSCAADVLTFYQERLANESYLRTASERVSLQEMSKLVGYRPRPGVAAETCIAFALETPAQAPPALASEPGSFVTGVPSQVSLPAGLQVRSIPGPDESPQTFETVEALEEARPEWNGMRPWLSEHRDPKKGDSSTYLEGVSTGLRRGDLLVFVREADPQARSLGMSWDFALVATVEPDPSAERTKVTWNRALTSFPETGVYNPHPILAYALRRRAHVFGYNAPDPRVLPRATQREFGLWTGVPPVLQPWNMTLSAFGVESAVDLDGVYADVAAGGWVVLALGAIDASGDVPAIPSRGTTGTALGEGLGGGGSRVPAVLNAPAPTNPVVTHSASSPDHAPLANSPVEPGLANASSESGRGYSTAIDWGADHTFEHSYQFASVIGLFSVAAVSEASRADFALAGNVSRLTLAPQAETYAKFKSRVRETTVFAASEQLRLAPHPVEDQVSGSRIPAAIRKDGLVGRRIVIRGTRVSDGSAFAAQARIEATTPASGGIDLHIHPPLPADVELRRDSVIVHANVALASHGETVSELLGAGNASAAFQRFELRQKPLTYRAAENEIGAKADITLRVSNIAWEERPTLYGAGARDRAYSLETDERGRLFAAFGDGIRGARPPTGVNNLLVKYRTGIGTEGNVAAEQLSQLLTRPLGVKSASNPLPAEGGTDPESSEDARQNVPSTTRTLGRVVSVLDYADFSRAFSGIAKAEAQVLHLSAGRTLAVTVVAPGGASLSEASPVWQNLLGALRRCGDPFVPLRLLAGEVRKFELGLRVKTDPAYERSQVLAELEGRLRSRYAFEARELGQPVQSSEVIAVAQGTPGVVAVDLAALHLTGEAAALPVRLLAARTCIVESMQVRPDGSSFKLRAARPAEILILNPERAVRLEVLS